MSNLEATVSMLEMLPEADIEIIYGITKKMFDEKQGSPFKPLSADDILRDLEISSEQFKQGKCSTAEEIVARARERYGL